MLRLHVYKYMFCGFIVMKDVIDVEMIHGIYISKCSTNYETL